MLCASFKLFLPTVENLAIDGNTTFSFISTTRDANPPVFTLSFNVTTRPPTIVTCSVNGTLFEIADGDLKREVIKSIDPIQVLVTITFRMRQSGTYECGADTGVTGLTRQIAPSLSITGSLRFLS